MDQRPREARKTIVAAGILVRDDYVISRSGLGNKGRRYARTRYVCLLACAPRRAQRVRPFPLPRRVYIRASRADGHLLARRGPRADARSCARNECVPARWDPLSFYQSRRREIGVNLRWRLAECAGNAR